MLDLGGLMYKIFGTIQRFWIQEFGAPYLEVELWETAEIAVACFHTLAFIKSLPKFAQGVGGNLKQPFFVKSKEVKYNSMTN